jgi:indole-3-glycerol phosphate synthase
MSSILNNIVASKRKLVAECKKQRPVEQLIRPRALHHRSLVKNLLNPGSTGIIAEFKRKSPSKGWLQKSVDIEPIVRSYEVNGAAGISVLTDQEFFGGELQDLEKARSVTTIPLLRKDFIIDEYQIRESNASGADVILLIAACLTPLEVKRFASFATSLGMESILEIHDESELDHLCDEVDMVGVNNRDLNTFEVTIEKSLQLIDRLPPEKPAISESGIDRMETIVTLRNAGYVGFLIGEVFMRNGGLTFDSR